MSRSVLLFALSIVLSLSFVLYSPAISNIVEATSPVNLTVTTYTGQSYLNINQSDKFNVGFSETSYTSTTTVTIYIPPNNKLSTNNKPYFFIDNNSIGGSCTACGWLDSKIINYLDDNESLSVVNITYTINNPNYGSIINIYFNATPINPQAILHTNWTGLIDTDTYSTQTPFTIRTPHLTITDNPTPTSRTVYLGDNLTIGEMIISNSDSQDYTGDAYNITATADNITNSLEILSNKIIDVIDNLSSGESTDTGQWTINAKSLGLSNISIITKDQTTAYNDTINVTINVVNLTVTPAILEDNPKIGEMITIIANITDNASNLFQPDINSIYANISYLALNETSGNLDIYESQACLSGSFSLNETLSGTDYTVFTCNTYIPERSGLYNLTISVTDQYFTDNGTATILKSKTTTNTSNFTVSFGKLNITNTFAMMMSVNDSFDNSQGFWQYGEVEGSKWVYDGHGSNMTIYFENIVTGNKNDNINLLSNLPDSKDTYVEVDIFMSYDEDTNFGIILRDNGAGRYMFIFDYSAEDEFGNYSVFSIIKRIGNEPSTIASGKYYTDVVEFHKVSVYAIGNEFVGLVDDNIVVHGFDNDNPIESGKVGIYTTNDRIFDNFKVYNILDPKDGLLNGQPFELRSFTEVIEGDIWGPINYTLSLANSKITNISNLQFSNTSNLRPGTTQIINWTLETTELGDTNLTIDITPTYGTKTTNEINTTIVPLFTYADKAIINYSDYNILYINVTGFGPSLQGPNGMFTATIKQEYIETATETTDFNFHTSESDIDNGYYVYWAYYTTTKMSGIYDLNFTMGNQYDQNITNTTESFFINYGTLNILLSTPATVVNGTYATQSAEIKASGGDLRNLSLNFTSYNTTVIDISQTDVINRTHNNLSSGTSFEYSWNISAKNTGVSNVTVKGVASFGTVLQVNNDTINVTLAPDEEAPKIHNVSVEYNLVNLKEHITIYADITDNYYVDTAIAQVFYPNLSDYSENYTMNTNYSTGEFYFIFQNTTLLTNETDFYNIQIYATDVADHINASDNTTTFNTTNKYTIGADYLNYNLFNLGEDVISTVPVYTVNNNPITDFNLTLLMKKQGDETDTVLLPNNQTNTYTYNINASDPIGLYNLDMNVSKDGNTANLSGTFTVSNVYTVDFIQPTYNFQTQKPQAYLYNSASPLIEVLNVRGEQVESWNVDVLITCAQEDNLTLYFNEDWQYYVDTGTKACQMPSFEGPFNILAFVNDTYNNSGASSIQMTLQEYTAPPAGGDSGGMSSPPSSGFPPSQDFTNYSSYEKRTEFFFYTDMRDLNMFQGEIRDMTFSLENTGDYDLNITTSYELDDLTLIINHSYFVKSKNKQSIPIKVISTLSDTPKTYFLKLKMTQGDIVKEETVTIWLEKNQLIYDLESLEHDLLRLNNMIADMDRIGINTKPYLQQLELSKQLLQAAKTAIASNNITSLNLQTTQLSDSLKSLDNTLIENEQIRWLFENKQNIAGIIISTIILLFLLKEYIYPLIYLSIKIQRLKSKKSLLEAEEKSTEKEYFTRVIDKVTFNKIITEKHEKLTDVRTQLVRMNKSLTRLTHGHRIKSEDLGKKHNLRQKIKSLFKPKPLKQPSLKKINNPLSKLKYFMHSKKQPITPPKTIAPINLAEKTPIYPKKDVSPVQQPKIKEPSIPSKQISKNEKNKNLGNEMREKYGGNDTKEDPKESFDDIKKKINNIFDD